MPDQRFESFKDGVAHVCKTEGREIVSEKGVLRFGIRTTGIKRYYEAKIASDQVDRVVSVPYNKWLGRSDILLVGDEQYRIGLIQEKMDTFPPCLYLSLERIVTRYQDGRQPDG